MENQYKKRNIEIHKNKSRIRKKNARTKCFFFIYFLLKSFKNSYDPLKGASTAALGTNYRRLFSVMHTHSVMSHSGENDIRAYKRDIYGLLGLYFCEVYNSVNFINQLGLKNSEVYSSKKSVI